MSSILLVEDDDSIVKSLGEYLTDEGFAVDTANGQREAQAKLEEKVYDLLLVDILSLIHI